MFYRVVVLLERIAQFLVRPKIGRTKLLLSAGAGIEPATNALTVQCSTSDPSSKYTGSLKNYYYTQALKRFVCLKGMFRYNGFTRTLLSKL